jgi:hypothetical protein
VRDSSGKRAAFGDHPTFQQDPNWCDHILFYEYFHGDTGEGLGASHQTGWTGIVARLIQFFSSSTAESVAEGELLANSAYLEPN